MVEVRGNGTRGLFIGGSVSSGDGRSSNVVDYITIQVPSDATDFESYLKDYKSECTASDTTRAICGGGMTTSNDVFTNEIQYFTMATTGDATDFGDLTRNTNAVCTGDGTYATWNGGMTSPEHSYYTNVIERVTIQTEILQILEIYIMEQIQDMEQVVMDLSHLLVLQHK